MNDYVEVRIDLDPCSEDMTDVLAAMLADAGFESFVPDAKGLLACNHRGPRLEPRMGEKLLPADSGGRQMRDPQFISHRYPPL